VKYIIERLNPAKHDRRTFDCGVAVLNDYLRERAGQDMRRHAAGCWVITANDRPNEVLGFYTLSPESIFLADLPELSKAARQRIPRYTKLGAVLLGRLAVAKTSQSKGLGQHLLYDAFHRAYGAEIPAALLVTDPKDENAERFYTKHGFRRLDETRMFILMIEIAELFATRD
jgi:GNAT superfamily N-acetyltransferase